MLHEIRWTPQKISRRLAEIKRQVYHHRLPLPSWRLYVLDGPDDLPPITPEMDDSDWETIEPYDYWGKPRLDFVLRTTFLVPEGWRDGGAVALHLPIGNSGDFSHPEALAYIDGEPYAACDRHHQEIILPERWCDGKTHTLALHGWTGIGGSTVGDPHQKLRMGVCEMVQIHQPTRDLITLAGVALGIANHLDESSTARYDLLNALDESFKALDLRIPHGREFYESVPRAVGILMSGIQKAGPPLNVDITAVGHAHIDVAWLWTLGQTRQKAARTFHNVIRLMEQFPEFHFAQSQPQLYEYIRRDFLSLFEAIQRRVSEGRWEPLGGMWVEADCNLSGGESLVRQFLLGRSFFRQYFGETAESPILWLPDVFGYAWNLPQLIKEAGLEYFFTIKIGWSQYNRLPYDSFWWQGIDGTRVLTHFSTTKEPDSPHAATYNADATPAQILGTWLNFQQKDYGTPGVTPPLLMSFGWGDGGGGPTREMLENIRVMGNFPATPQTHPGSVYAFFQKLERDVGERLPTWNGELYLEYHRGTYTTQAEIKRANRKSEFLLHDTEFLATYAAVIDEHYQYPVELFLEAWRLVCLNQFHDIITGSSIGAVYTQAREQYQQIQSLAEKAQESALTVIQSAMGGDLLVINPTSFVRNDLVLWSGELDTNTVPYRHGKPITLQKTEEGVLLDLGDLPPYSIVALSLEPHPPETVQNTIDITPTKLENAYLRVELNQEGDIIRIFDKISAREVLPPGGVANQFQAFEDRPLSWDAWDIEIYYDDKVWFSDPAHSIRIIEKGPLRGTLEIRRRILQSEYIQRISLCHNSTRLDFDTQIQWQERSVLLKVAFPVDILSPIATYEIQWGNVERPTHRNTSWDWARFETAAQKWVDLSEGGYGVSLLNDCKYGHDIQDNIMRLTLLRSTNDPDPQADLGEHKFAYSLLPHTGRWDEPTVTAAYALNDPLIAVSGNHAEPILSPRPFISCTSENVVIETIKLAEDGEGIIVRLYECQRKRGNLILETGFPIAAAWQTNILENINKPLKVNLNQIHLAIKPYQILTVYIRPEKHGDFPIQPINDQT